jgi:hypothetical protein
VPEISDELWDELLKRSTDLLEGVLFDENGAMVAGQFMGGNGGNISRETLRKAGPLAQTINTINARRGAKTEG